MRLKRIDVTLRQWDGSMTTDEVLRDILTSTKVIALVGWSPKTDRPSHRVARFLAERGYRVIPVNPGHSGTAALGTTVRASLSEITEPVDMVDIFRRSEEVLPVVEEAMRVLPGLTTIWMQLGVTNPEATAIAEARDLRVVQNRCPLIEIARLGL
jgi:hypothetical protein